MEFRLALKDSDEGIKLDPTFRKKIFEERISLSLITLISVKCYLRKGHALVAMKDPAQAMSAFGKALEIDPNCQVKRHCLLSRVKDQGFLFVGSD